MTAADGLIEAAEATRNPWAISFVLAAYATAFGDAYPDRALDAFRRGLVVAQESGNRFIEFQLAALNLSRLEVAQGDLLSAFDHFSLAIRNMHDSANTTTIFAAAGSSRHGSGPADATSRRPQSPGSRAVPSPRWHTPR